MSWNYNTIKKMARELHCKATDLIALSSGNDPFYTGAPATVAAAQWFADVWQRFGYTTGVHLRRVHYELISQRDPVKLPTVLKWKDGDTGRQYETDTYTNVDRCWGYLVTAGKHARYQGLVDPCAFDDRRNPAARIHAQYEPPPDDPGYVVYRDGWSGVAAFGANANMPTLPPLLQLPRAPRLIADDYETRQEYLIEVWAEKSTQDDILLPLCQSYDVNLVTGLGELSITAVIALLARIEHIEKPTRILYVSDFDPSGLGMPISVARKIEFYQRNGDYGKWDVRLDPVVLTADQVADYDLPRAPVKPKDKRKRIWELDHGEGQVELDALQALYPGKLHEIMEGAILRYYDPELGERARRMKSELQVALDKAWQEVSIQHADAAARLEADYNELKDSYNELRKQFNEHARVFQPKLSAWAARFAELTQAGADFHKLIAEDLREVDVDPDDFPLPVAELPPEGNGMLYVSGRNYLEQITMYAAGRHGAKGGDHSGDHGGPSP